jgi:hypothetical protein
MRCIARAVTESAQPNIERIAAEALVGDVDAQRCCG